MDNAALTHDVIIVVNWEGLLTNSWLVNAVEENSIVFGCKE